MIPSSALSLSLFSSDKDYVNQGQKGQKIFEVEIPDHFLLVFMSHPITLRLIVLTMLTEHKSTAVK